jgi:glycosidase
MALLLVMSAPMMGQSDVKKQSESSRSQAKSQTPAAAPASGRKSISRMGEVVEPFSPIRLSGKKNTVDIRDYFPQLNLVSKVSFNGEPVKLVQNRYFDITSPMASPVGQISVATQDGQNHVIWVFDTNKSSVVFNYIPKNANAKTVQMAGEINGWNKNATTLTKNNRGEWSVALYVAPGEYAYRIWEDNEEGLDQNNTLTRDNGMGGKNSVWKVGNVETEKPLLRTFMANDTQIQLVTNTNLDRVFALYNNQPLSASIDKKGTVVINGPWSNQSGYIRVVGYKGNQISNEVVIPMAEGQVIMNPRRLSRTDNRSKIMYFMMVDRFMDGDSTNNQPTSDPAILPKANYLGGDFQGINAKINSNYFKQLGVNTLWISPVSQNVDGAWGLWEKGKKSKFSAYHGYWPLSLTKVEPRLGGEKAFGSVIQQAHAQQMNVVLDYVAHHVHQNHPLVKQHPDWFTPLYLKDGTKNTEKWDEHRLTTWFDDFLPTFDFSNPAVVEAMSDSAMFWLRKYELDGFRHDATKHIHSEFWKELTYKMHQEFPTRPIYQVGETYGNPELIGSYLGTGQMDAQFDFNLYDAAVDAFGKENNGFQNLNRVFMESLNSYGAHHTMGNISGNQDRPRFISLADGSLAWDEDMKTAGWARNIDNKGAIGYIRLEQLFAFILTVPGVPCIYYGDEIGMPGANDPDNRRMMKFDNLNVQQRQIKQSVSKLTAIRNNHMALTYGETKVLLNTNQNYAYIRQYFGDQVLVVFADKRSSVKDTSMLFIPLPEGWSVPDFAPINGSEIQRVQGGVKVRLSAKGYDVFIEKKTGPAIDKSKVDPARKGSKKDVKVAPDDQGKPDSKPQSPKKPKHE